MSSVLHYFAGKSATNAVVLSFEINELLAQWESLRSRMIRLRPSQFTRDEWAYLIRFVESKNLNSVFERAFGRRTTATSFNYLLRPRTTVAVWLPNNVSLLGPLSLILLSLTGSRLLLKLGSRNVGLTAAFLGFVRDNLPHGVLLNYLNDAIELKSFDRSDPMSQQWIDASDVQIVFGSDEAVRGVRRAAQSTQSLIFGFSDRVSEAWIEPKQVNPAALNQLMKIFAIYGRLGCTSPRRVVLIDGDEQDAVRLRDGLAETWSRIEDRPPLNVASENIRELQWAKAHGWDPLITQGRHAMLASGSAELPLPQGGNSLAITTSPLKFIASSLPQNIQTIGHLVENASDVKWLNLLAVTKVKRFVKLADMHHFGAVWDGWKFWESVFEVVEISV